MAHAADEIAAKRGIGVGGLANPVVAVAAADFVVGTGADAGSLVGGHPPFGGVVGAGVDETAARGGGILVGGVAAGGLAGGEGGEDKYCGEQAANKHDEFPEAVGFVFSGSLYDDGKAT